MLDNAMLKEIAAKKMVTPAAKREAVAHLRCAFEVSERRACSVLGADRTSVRYRSTRPDDAGLRLRLRELAGQRRRFGYRRLHILLTREGLANSFSPAFLRPPRHCRPAPAGCSGPSWTDGAYKW